MWNLQRRWPSFIDSITILLVLTCGGRDARAQSGMLGNVDGTSQESSQTVLKGWACWYGSTASEDVHVYAGGPFGVGTLIAYGSANLPNEQAVTTACGAGGNHRYSVSISPSVIAQYGGQPLYVYGVCLSGQSGCQNTLLGGSGYWYVAYHFSAASNPTGWSDNQNYFTKWGCTPTPNGINYIARLNIAPIGTHPTNVWKDSFYADMTNFVGGNPVLYFTAGNYNATPVFSLEKATFNGSTWVITDLQDDPSTHGGISSLDGTGSDYGMNEYDVPGWGPIANKPGAQSMIPGVSQEHAAPNTADCPNQVCPVYPAGYPLWGSGPLGITQMQTGCIHMNPTFFDYDINGHPQSLLACLWRDGQPDDSVACALPGAPQQSGYYAYHYNATTGWQLDTSSGLSGPIGNCSKVDAVKYIRNSQQQFIYAVWGGAVQVIDRVNGGPPTQALNCLNGDPTKAVTFSQASGTANTIYLQIDPPGPKCGSAAGLVDTNNPNNPVCVHDLYVAFKN